MLDKYKNVYPHTHFLVGLAIGAVGAQTGYFNAQEAFALAIIATFVDIDHYIYYSHKYKTLSFFHAWEMASSHRDNGGRTAIHHAVGFLFFTIVLLLLFLIDQKWALLLGLAYYSHILLDYLPIETKRLKFEFIKLKFNMSLQEVILDFIFVGFSLILLIE